MDTPSLFIYSWYCCAGAPLQGDVSVLNIRHSVYECGRRSPTDAHSRLSHGVCVCVCVCVCGYLRILLAVVVWIAAYLYTGGYRVQCLSSGLCGCVCHMTAHIILFFQTYSVLFVCPLRRASLLRRWLSQTCSNRAFSLALWHRPAWARSSRTRPFSRRLTTPHSPPASQATSRTCSSQVCD
jgi:hypothetical protein